MEALHTSEFVCRGHPDKVADQIADAVLDAHLAQDPTARVACEVLLARDVVVVAGEVASRADVDAAGVARRVLLDVGYGASERGLDGATVAVWDRMTAQSPEIARAVCGTRGRLGAGDQGIMIGHADASTPSRLPLAHELARRLIALVEADVAAGRVRGGWDSPFLPDGKCQVTLATEDGRPTRVDTVVPSVAHPADVALPAHLHNLRERVVEPFGREHPDLVTARTRWLLNPSAAWHRCGPAADTGLTGRKTVMDSYGPGVPIGGGSFSGKDPTKVDRSGAYAARHLALDLLRRGIGPKVTVEIAYAIGVAEPVSLRIEASGPGGPPPPEIARIASTIRDTVDLTPRGILDRFGLQRPLYRATASGGHFGRPEFPWETPDPKVGNGA